MNLLNLIEALQALAAKTPDGGANVDVRSIFNNRGNPSDAFPLYSIAPYDEFGAENNDGTPSLVVLSYE